MSTLHLWPYPQRLEDGSAICSARVEDHHPFDLWFRVPEVHGQLLTARAEPFVAATVFRAMWRGAKLRVHATLSPSFLRNLEELQVLWSCWHPSFQPVEIEPDGEGESEVVAPDRAVSTFSGGVDSFFTIWRHTQRLCGRRALPLQTAVLLHGAEIRLSQTDLFARVFRQSLAMLEGLPITLVPLATNVLETMPQEHVLRWFGAALTSTLLLFQESHTAGLIPASARYDYLLLPFATTPLNDPLFSTARFPIEHDGSGETRTDKLRQIISWPGARKYLRVCNAPGDELNCGRCEKCVRNILTLRILGEPQPACFPHPLTPEDIERVYMTPTNAYVMAQLFKEARAVNLVAPWLREVRTAIRRNQRRERWERVRRQIDRRMPRWARAPWKRMQRRLWNIS